MGYSIPEIEMEPKSASLSPEAQYQIQRARRLLEERNARRERLRELAAAAASALKQDHGASRVWLFGSVLRAWFHEGSDMDLAVEGIPPGKMGVAWRRVEEISGCPVDLVAIEEADDRMKSRILMEGEEIG